MKHWALICVEEDSLENLASRLQHIARTVRGKRLLALSNKPTSTTSPSGCWWVGYGDLPDLNAVDKIAKQTK